MPVRMLGEGGRGRGRVPGPIGRFVGLVVGFCGREADAVVSLYLAEEVSVM